MNPNPNPNPISSNPFRQSVQSNKNSTGTITTTTTAATADWYPPVISDVHTADHDPAPRPKASTSAKKVRISSPPRSPSPRRSTHDEQAHTSRLASQDTSPYYDASSLAPTRHSSSQRWQHRHTSSSAEEESSSSDDDDHLHSHSKNNEIDTVIPTKPRTTSAVPDNPFARTLADVEQSSPAADSGRTSDNADPSNQHGRSISRAGMDVNAFKNLLMTGKASHASPDQPNQPTQPTGRVAALTLADNSSSTDTSSISRQSIVENMSNETPRTSYERSISEEEEDSATILQRRESKRVKPPLPRHRHGKSVTTSTGPQIVSFNDFSPVGPQVDISSPADERPARSSSELRRPLPPIPTPAPAPAPALAPRLEPTLALSAEPREITPSPDNAEQAPQSRKPPPPPLARRSSHRASMQLPIRPRSGTSSSRPSLIEDDESIAESTTSSNKTAPPPPPPTRRSAHSNHPADEGSPSSSASRTPSLKSPPPPPSRNRASSNLSAISIPSTLSITPTSATVPPPPPPRRTSSRSSIEIMSPRQPSAEIFRSSFDGDDRRPSFSSSVRRVPITEEALREDESAITLDSSGLTSPSAKDILADMDAFQRELDALMAKDEMGRRKSSAGSASMRRPEPSSSSS